MATPDPQRKGSEMGSNLPLPSMRLGDIEVQGLSDGILRTSLEFVIGMKRVQAESQVGETQNGSI